MSRVLITGVTGQDGSYLSERLLEGGHQVHGLVRPDDSGPVDPRVVPHAGDLLDGDGLAAVVAEVRPDVIYNLAGLTSVAASWQDPVLAAQTTGLAVLHLLEAARRLHEAGHSVRFLQASSSEIFGDSPDLPQHEDSPIRPISPYGAAKAFAHASTAIQRSHGLHASTVILYGHESPRRPPTFAARKITAGVAAIARGEAETLTLGNLDAARDWGWAPDFVSAMLTVVAHDEPADFIVSTGEAHTVREFVATAFAAAGVPDWETRIRIDPALMRPNDRSVQIGDATRLRALGWRPSKTFAELVATMVEADLHQY
ncbi:MAG TPA: GDP-mannose 4,6-dehydratase [Propionibacteriaceae bacterium]